MLHQIWLTTILYWRQCIWGEQLWQCPELKSRQQGTYNCTLWKRVWACTSWRWSSWQVSSYASPDPVSYEIAKMLPYTSSSWFAMVANDGEPRFIIACISAFSTDLDVNRKCYYSIKMLLGWRGLRLGAGAQFRALDLDHKGRQIGPRYYFVVYKNFPMILDRLMGKAFSILLLLQIKKKNRVTILVLRSYQLENTDPRKIIEVKQAWAPVVGAWGISFECGVL